MRTLEQAGFGRLDSSNFGLWLNIDPVLTVDLGAELAPLTLSSFHFPLNDEHRGFIDRLQGDELTFVLNCFTTFAHERRHFHDLLATPYGAVLMRQYSRATLLGLASRRDLYFHSDAIAVPLSTWIANIDGFTLSHDVPPPLNNLRQLHEQLAIMQEKLAIFNAGVAALPKPFARVDATAILEGMAILTQQYEIERVFGISKVPAFLNAFREPNVQLKYFGAIALCAAVLGRDIPAEVLSYLLLVSLCGDFQDPRADTPRYPVHLLTALLSWLHENSDVHGLHDFHRFAASVDDFFDSTYGDDVQGMTIKAAKVNEQASGAFREMVDEFEKVLGPDESFHSALAVFDNFRKVQAAFAANVMMSPLWYVGSTYSESTAALPTPVIFLECEMGFPVDPQLEELYYIQTETRIAVNRFPPYLAERFMHLADSEGVIRGAHILSPRGGFHADQGKYPLPFAFDVPEIDIALWQRVFDSGGAMLRFLIEGPDGMLEPLVKTILLTFAMMGVKVFDRTGELLPPPVPEDPDDNGIDPEMRQFLRDPEFREALKIARDRRKRSQL